MATFGFKVARSLINTMFNVRYTDKPHAAPKFVFIGDPDDEKSSIANWGLTEDAKISVSYNDGSYSFAFLDGTYRTGVDVTVQREDLEDFIAALQKIAAVV